MQEIIEYLRLLKNKIRITFLKYFTDRVKQVTITDPQGQEHEFTTEQTVEKVCDHKTIKEISHALYKCEHCDTYFFITYKVMLNRPELVTWAESIADSLGAKLIDKDYDVK